MTTKAHIINFGPDPIDVFLVERGTAKSLPALKRLPVGDYMDVYVHRYQDIYIMEVKADQKVAPPQQAILNIEETDK